MHELPWARDRSPPVPDLNTSVSHGRERRKHTRRMGLTGEISLGLVAMALAVYCVLVVRSWAMVTGGS